jgi:hypothetical protein
VSRGRRRCGGILSTRTRRAIRKDSDDRFAVLSREVPRPGGPGPRPDAPSVRDQLIERTSAKALAVLSADQKEQWKELLGKSFEFTGPASAARRGSRHCLRTQAPRSRWRAAQGARPVK